MTKYIDCLASRTLCLQSQLLPPKWKESNHLSDGIIHSCVLFLSQKRKHSTHPPFKSPNADQVLGVKKNCKFLQNDTRHNFDQEIKLFKIGFGVVCFFLSNLPLFPFHSLLCHILPLRFVSEGSHCRSLMTWSSCRKRKLFGFRHIPQSSQDQTIQ